MKRSALLAAVLLACAAPDPAPAGHPAASTAVRPVAGDSARGIALVRDFRDSLPAHSGNALRCTSCHLEGGLRAAAMPWVGTASRYPRFRSRRGEMESITQRVNDCIARSLAGRVLDDSSSAMRDIVAYLQSIDATVRPAGVDTVSLEGHPEQGADGYRASCARCHGTEGEGTMIAPALWGADSYSIGAGMARQRTLATFVLHNMPFDQPGSLTPAQAADIAAYVLAQPRQDYPGKEADWPGGSPPADVAYPTEAARAAGKPVPAVRPVLPRRVDPGWPTRR